MFKSLEHFIEDMRKAMFNLGKYKIVIFDSYL